MMKIHTPDSGRFSQLATTGPHVLGKTTVLLIAFSLCTSALAQEGDEEDDYAELDIIQVQAQDYVSTASQTATKTNAPLIEIPQSVTVISRDQIDQLHWTSLDQSVRYTAGATGENFGPDERYDWLTIRGFNPVQYIDGLQAPVGSVNNIGTDLYGFQAVDVLKGPASVLYGQSPPGGIVNMTSRRPESSYAAEIGLQAGSHDHKQINADVTGSVGNDVSGRFTALFRDRETQTDFTESQRIYIAPALTFDISADTELTLLSYYQQDNIDNQSTGFLPAQGTLLPNPHGQIPVSRNIGEPGLNFFDRTQYGVGYEFTHRFSDNFTMQQNVKYFDQEVESREIYGTGFEDMDGDGVPDDFRTVTRSDFPFNEEVDSFNIDTRGYFELSAGDVDHTLMVGLDHRQYSNQSESGFDAAPSIDIFDPEYGQAIDDPALFPFADQEQDQTGLYIQDQIRTGNMIITLGGRQDWLSSENEGVSTSESKLTYRAGINYLFDNGFAPYAQTATSFQPVPGVDVSGNAFDPSTGTQYEIGLKHDGARMGDNWRFFGSAAMYQIVQENVLTPDPDNPLFSVQAGEVEVSGFELEAVARYQQRLSFNASYSRTDSEVTESTGPDLGQRLPMVPKHKFSLLTDYTIQDGPLAGLGVNLGMRYLSATYGDPANEWQGDSVTLFDTTVRYDYDFWRFALNVSNLTDESYVARCSSAIDCFYGTERMVIGSVTRSF
ncbi:iron complex outermembrane receptor protein [Natronospira proteinivora]|uniref:Iron complex outermembrane receptor protein n=1 Tax=Natronospira proteinivora TaxID=1807133 RepID=A0ABT1G8G0_9GAMM|nr:TonB-dependent siderophore receptor [Natronospira proteinivora]MCP1727592.1 iron complex outermembrane receptor protein [Natronospira proteinivora]